MVRCETAAPEILLRSWSGVGVQHRMTGGGAYQANIGLAALSRVCIRGKIIFVTIVLAMGL